MPSPSSSSNPRHHLQALLQQAARPTVATPASGHCVVIRGSGQTAPLVCVAGGGAGIPSYRRLSELLPEVPMFATHLISAENIEKPLESIEAIAAAHREILERQLPVSPLVLCGHSFGATLAFEVAQQLTARGRKVQAVVILDQPGPDVRLTLRHWLYWQWVALSQLSWKMRFAYVLDGVRFRLRRLRWLPRASSAWFLSKQNLSGDPPSDRRPSTHQYRRQLADASIRALRAYRPMASLFPVVLVRARSGTPRIHADPQGGWGNVARGGLRVVDVPGTHMQLFREPSFSLLAKTIRELLSEHD